MTKKDREEIKKIVIAAVREALTVKATIEKVRDEKTGVPLAVSERKTEKVFIPSLIAQMLPFMEGSFRGVQEDMGKRQGEIVEASKQFAAVAGLLIVAEPVLTKLAQFTDYITEQIENKRNLIE